MSEDVELLEEQKSQDDDQQRDPALDWFLTLTVIYINIQQNRP